MSIRSRIRDAFRMQSESSQHEGRYLSLSPPSNLNIPMPQAAPPRSPFARGGRLHFAAGSYDPEAIPKLTLDREPWRMLQEIGIAYEVALGAVLTCVKNGDIEIARLYIPRIMKVVQQADQQYPDGRRVIRLYTETFYAKMNRQERVLLGIDEAD